MKGITSPQQLNDVLTTLASNIDTPIVMSIDGSAAMLHYGSELPAGEVTVIDLDCPNDKLNQFEEAVIATAEHHNLPPGWLNYLNRGKEQEVDTANPIFDTDGLYVFIPTPTAMLSDRISDGIAYGADMHESVALCKHLNINDTTEIRDTYLRQLGTTLETSTAQSTGDQLEETIEDLADRLNHERLTKRAPKQDQDAMQL